MELVALRDRIEQTNRRLVTLNRDFVERPDIESLGLTIRNLTRHRDQLEVEWAKLANQMGKDVCTYFIYSDSGERASVRAVADILAAFQKSVATIYDGIKSGPKDRVPSSRALHDETDFEFGFTSPGSLMITFTVQARQLSFWEDEVSVSDAVLKVHEMLKASSSFEILQIAQKYGRPAVRCVYDLIRMHLRHRSSMRISWLPESSRGSLDIMTYEPKMTYLKALIEDTRREDVSELAITGSLRAWDMVRRRFTITVDDEWQELVGSRRISGRVMRDVDMNRQIAFSGHYSLELDMMIQEEMASDKVDRTFRLYDLRLLTPSLAALD